jgi:hypothetical protein
MSLVTTYFRLPNLDAKSQGAPGLRRAYPPQRTQRKWAKSRLGFGSHRAAQVAAYPAQAYASRPTPVEEYSLILHRFYALLLVYIDCTVPGEARSFVPAQILSGCGLAGIKSLEHFLAGKTKKVRANSGVRARRISPAISVWRIRSFSKEVGYGSRIVSGPSRTGPPSP